MSVVIIGGHERMEAKYKEICKKYNCKPKIFTKAKVNLKDQIGCPDLMILFTSTVSHSLVQIALTESERNNIEITRSHSSSASALINILEKYT